MSGGEKITEKITPRVHPLATLSGTLELRTAGTDERPTEFFHFPFTEFFVQPSAQANDKILEPITKGVVPKGWNQKDTFLFIPFDKANRFI